MRAPGRRAAHSKVPADEGASGSRDPNAGQPYYYVTAPLFRRVRLRVGARTLTIATAERPGGSVRYVAAATLNGTPLRRAWITHRQLAAGGRLRLTLADHPTTWATQAQPPPSLTD